MNDDQPDSKLKIIEKGIQRIEEEHQMIEEWDIPRDRSAWSGTHDYHPYFAAFPPEIPAKLIRKYTKEGDVVLDPFMGGGSTIVEAYKLKRKAMGSDVSSLSKLITEVKTRPLVINDNEFYSILGELKQDYASQKIQGFCDFDYVIPEDITNIDFWFSRDSQCGLSIILHHLNRIKDEGFRRFMKLGLSAIVRKGSNAHNTLQHPSRKKDKKIPDVLSMFETKINLMKVQMGEYLEILGNKNGYHEPELHVHDIRKIDEVIQNNHVDCVVTSPPYGTGSKYTMVHRFEFEWLDLPKPTKENSLELLKKDAFGDEVKAGFSSVYKILKKGGYCFVVYGDPSTQDSLTTKLIEDATDIGFKYEGLISCPIKKVKSKHHEPIITYIPKDFILFFRK